MGSDITRYQYKINDSHQYYYQVMRKTIVQFLDLFNDIKIGRYDTTTGQLLSFIKVPLKFAPKSKNWYWVEKIDSNGQRIRDKIMPIMAVNLVDIEIATDRKVNKHYSARTASSTIDNRFSEERFINPVPYNYTFQLQILSEYMVDVVQIMEQILPYFDPHMFIEITIPEINIDGETTEMLKLKVLYNGSNKEESLTMGPDEYRYLQWNIDFTVEGYLFQPKYDYPIIKYVYEEMILGEQPPAPSLCEPQPTPSGGPVLMYTEGISSSVFPIETSSEELSGSFYDDTIKTIYKYELREDLK